MPLTLGRTALLRASSSAMPEEPFPIAPLSDRDPRGVGWSETRFRESFRERRLSPAEETDNARERDGHSAAPVTTVRSGRSSVRGSNNILVENSFKAPMPSHFCVNEIFFNKADHLPERPSRLIQKENLRNH